MTNPFEGLAGTLSPEQRVLLLEALGVEAERPAGAIDFPVTLGAERVSQPRKKAPAAKKNVKKKVVSKKATITEEVVPVPARRKSAVKKVVRDNFRVENEDGSSGARRAPVRFRGNTWTDDGKLDKNKRTATPEYDPMPRERPEMTYVNKRCHVCGKDFKVRSDLVHGEFHRCSKCI